MFVSAVRTIVLRSKVLPLFAFKLKSAASYAAFLNEQTVAIKGISPQRTFNASLWKPNSRTHREWKSIAPAPLCLAGLLSFLRLDPKKEEDPLIQTIKLGILDLQRGEYKKAERLLHLALKMSQERMDADAETYCFDVMAEIALASGDLDKAEKLFVEVMRRLISVGTSQEDDAIVEISAKLACIFSRRRDDAKAEQGFQFCIDTQHRKLNRLDRNIANVTLAPEEENSLALWGMCMDWYAKHLMDRGKYIQARELLIKSLEVAQKVFGDTHPQTLVIRNDLALTNTMLKDYKGSIHILEDLVASGAADQSEDLPTFLCNLGENYLANGDINNAEKWCGRAENAARKQQQQDALKCAQICLEKAREAKKVMSSTRSS